MDPKRWTLQGYQYMDILFDWMLLKNFLWVWDAVQGMDWFGKGSVEDLTQLL